MIKPTLFVKLVKKILVCMKINVPRITVMCSKMKLRPHVKLVIKIISL